jgi:hypothetical protein
LFVAIVFNHPGLNVRFAAVKSLFTKTCFDQRSNSKAMPGTGIIGLVCQATLMTAQLITLLKKTMERRRVRN